MCRSSQTTSKLGMRNTLLTLAAILAAGVSPALGHRLPEAEVTIENVQIDGAAKSAFTIRLHAEDVLKLLGRELDLDVDLTDPELHQVAGAKVLTKVQLESGALQFFGGSVEGNSVYLFFTADADAQVRDASILSSVFDRWTNRINDARAEDVQTKVFTQGGELHGHRH